MEKICKHCSEKHTLRGNECRICKDGKYRYNMTRLDQIKMMEEQDNQCTLCDMKLELFSGHKGGMIDHDHKTGKVRGIVCNRCNTIIGGLETHKDIRRILNYLSVG